MAHRYKKVARRLQKQWEVTYSTALRACTDLSAESDFDTRITSKMQAGMKFNDALFELCAETWEFDAPS